MASRELRRAKQKKVETVSDTIEKRHESHPLRYAMVVIVLVVIVVTFVLAGPGGPLTRGMGGGNNIVFGSYMGKEIAYYPGGYFAQERDRIANQYRNSSANQNTVALAQAVWYQAFLNTAEHIAVLTQAEQGGIQISEDAVDKALLNYPAYLDDNGKFSETRYAATSASDKADTRRLMRESMETNIFATDLQTGGRHDWCQYQGGFIKMSLLVVCIFVKPILHPSALIPHPFLLVLLAFARRRIRRLPE